MNANNAQLQCDLAAAYVRGNFEEGDHLAIVLIHRGWGSVIQRLATAQRIASPEFLAYLSKQNGRGYDVYVSMNALSAQATGRTKADIETVRHLYLDFDQDGEATVNALSRRKDLPPVSFILNTSPGKWQVTWKVKGFSKAEAEALQKALARASGGDPAATDCARVLRVPGFYNHKYAEPYLVRVEPYNGRSGPIYTHRDFAKFAPDIRLNATPGHASSSHVQRNATGKLSQSERDWSFAKRALARGEPEHLVIAAIASHRRYEKHNPEYYAELTVRKAAQSLATDAARCEPTTERGL